ncbi:helix-turn-helix domain-containing protein [Chryseobacterium sp. KACC 21268]|nr:helix-turn-helix domain-containing protein [Chryseobacterium sp. KACC 21268]
MALKQIIENILSQGIQLDRKMLMTEKEVAQLLRVSERTMRTYRHQNYFHHIKIEGNVFYLQFILFLDLIILSLESGG